MIVTNKEGTGITGVSIELPLVEAREVKEMVEQLTAPIYKALFGPEGLKKETTNRLREAVIRMSPEECDKFLADLSSVEHLMKVMLQGVPEKAKIMEHLFGYKDGLPLFEQRLQ